MSSIRTAAAALAIAESVVADRPGISAGELSTSVALELVERCRYGELEWPADQDGIDAAADTAAAEVAR